MAKLLRPWQELVRDKLLKSNLSGEVERQAWLSLTNSYNSDGQWPPTLPDAPHIIHPFNYGYCFENLLQAELLVGGIDREPLTTDAVATLEAILCPQQALILKKAEQLLSAGSACEKQNAALAKMLIETVQNLDMPAFRRTCSSRPSTGSCADAMVAARRLVGGVEIEVVHDMKAGEAK